MTDTTLAVQTNDVQVVPVTDIKNWVAKVGTNPATLEFPTDRWGFTSGIKREVLKAAATIKGQDDKEALITAVLAILLQHIRVRHQSDKELQEDRKARYIAAAEERAPRERVGAAVIDPTTVK